LCCQPRNRLVNRLYATVEKRYLQTVDGFIFNSRTTRQAVAKLVDGARSEIVACPAGDRLGFLTSAEAVVPRARTGGPLKLIFVGNLLPHKGLVPLIQALDRLPPQAWHLTVVGNQTMDRHYARRVLGLIARMKIGRNVDMIGPQNGEELAGRLSQSHVFVMPYSHESFGMAYLEAMAFALPVIGSSSGAVKEFVTPGKNGFLIVPGDLNTVAACLNMLHGNRQRLIEMSRAALQIFHARPKWNDTMQSIHGFLSALAASGPDRSRRVPGD
jgi:glycosyltransferase involved in cell wall biosynthesis